MSDVLGLFIFTQYHFKYATLHCLIFFASPVYLIIELVFIAFAGIVGTFQSTFFYLYLLVNLPFMNCLSRYLHPVLSFFCFFIQVVLVFFLSFLICSTVSFTIYLLFLWSFEGCLNRNQVRRRLSLRVHKSDCSGLWYHQLEHIRAPYSTFSFSRFTYSKS